MNDSVTASHSRLLGERIAVVVLLWIAGGVLFVVATGIYPRTSLGWVLFVGLAPALFFLGHFVGEFVVAALLHIPGIRHFKESVERATADRRFSGVRVVVALVALLGFGGLGLVAFALLHEFIGEAARPVGDFLRVHYGAL